MGFQHMLPVVRKAAQRKGGSVRKRKGLATLTLEERHNIAVLGGKARHDYSSRKGTVQTQEGEDSNLPRLGDLSRELIDEL